MSVWLDYHNCVYRCWNVARVHSCWHAYGICISQQKPLSYRYYFCFMVNMFDVNWFWWVSGLHNLLFVYWENISLWPKIMYDILLTDFFFLFFQRGPKDSFIQFVLGNLWALKKQQLSDCVIIFFLQLLNHNTAFIQMPLVWTFYTNNISCNGIMQYCYDFAVTFEKLFWIHRKTEANIFHVVGSTQERSLIIVILRMLNNPLIKSRQDELHVSPQCRRSFAKRANPHTISNCTECI